jgi:hypothetical protein
VAPAGDGTKRAAGGRAASDFSRDGSGRAAAGVAAKGGGYPPATSAAAPPPVASAQSSLGYGNGPLQPAPAVTAAPQQQQPDLHQRADALAHANRCDEAVKLYAEIDRRAERMLPKERANYVRCLTQTGRQEAAEQQLDELKADKSVTNGLVRRAEGDVEQSRRGVRSEVEGG